MRPAQPTPLHLLLRTYLRMGDQTACANAFWEYWPGIRGHRPGEGKTGDVPVIHGASGAGGGGGRGGEERFGDGWAWQPWEGASDAGALAGIAEVAATCFVGLKRCDASTDFAAVRSVGSWSRCKKPARWTLAAVTLVLLRSGRSWMPHTRGKGRPGYLQSWPVRMREATCADGLGFLRGRRSRHDPTTI